MGWELGRHGEGGLGGIWRSVLSPACQSLLHHLTRLSSETRRNPTLPVGKAGVWGTGKGGKLKPVPLQGTSPLHTCPAPENAPQDGCHMGQMKGRGWRREASLFPLGRKFWRKEGLHSHAHRHTLSLSEPPVPNHCLAILKLGT